MGGREGGIVVLTVDGVGRRVVVVAAAATAAAAAAATAVRGVMRVAWWYLPSMG